MRIQVDFSSHLSPSPNQSPVVQVEKTPILGEEGQTVINGKFLLPVPLDLDFPVRGVHSGLITGVSSNSGVAVFASLAHGLKEGDIVSITGTANYDGVFIVSLSIDEDRFSLGGVAFVADEPGTFQRGDYLLNDAGDIDGNDLASQSMARLLAVYPMFGNIYFNPLLTDEHVDELDFTFDWKEPGTGDIFNPRFQTGREAPLDDSGQYPTHTALLSANNTVSPRRPGLIVTDEIDIGPCLAGYECAEVVLAATTEGDIWRSRTGPSRSQQERLHAEFSESWPEPMPTHAALRASAGFTRAATIARPPTVSHATQRTRTPPPRNWVGPGSM